jgi:hypothetical protein
MGGCIVTYTGTGERIPELMGKNTGELLLGITEPVFRRSAFITRPEIAVEKDAELEKRITALVTSVKRTVPIPMPTTGSAAGSESGATAKAESCLRRRAVCVRSGRLCVI